MRRLVDWAIGRMSAGHVTLMVVVLMMMSSGTLTSAFDLGKYSKNIP